MMPYEISDSSAQEKFGSGKEIHNHEQEVKNRLEQGIREAEKELKRQLTPPEKEDTEKRIAFLYAKEQNLWIEDLYSLGEPTGIGGNENTLAIDKENKIVYKSNNLLNSLNLISILIRNIRIHNELFPETKYELMGFTGIDNGKRPPYVEVIIKQDYIPNAEQATPTEIAKYMQSIGFKQINEHTFSNEQYKISDLRPRNVLKDKNGVIYVVDAVYNENYG
jgi:hypothetical protein